MLLAVQHMQDPAVSPVALEIGLALLGAALGGLLLTPIIRTMRSFVSALEVPEWALHQLHFPPWLSFTLHLNLVLPALGMVVWVRPLPENPSIPLLGFRLITRLHVRLRSNWKAGTYAGR